MPKLAVIIPCFNEEAAIGRVVADFRAALPRAIVFVYDDNSTDRTAAAAATAGAVVRDAGPHGGRHVVRRMFADVDADIYVLVEGDDTYDAAAAPKMVDMLTSRGLDMVNGARAPRGQATRAGRLGEAMLNGVVGHVFGMRFNDIPSGYRVFSRRFVKSFPARAAGHEAGAEFTLHALALRMPIGEVRTSYRDPADGAEPRRRAGSRRMRVPRAILMLVRDERPLQFFGLCASLFLAAAMFALAQPAPPLLAAMLAPGLVLLAAMALICGLILEGVTRARREAKLLAYLAIPPLPMDDV